jgi:hypothetical protein
LAVFSVTYDWYFERHEIRIRGRDHTIVFIADSQDGRLVIRQEPDGKKSKEVCAIRLSDPDELRAFFKGLRRILSSLGYAVESGEAPAVTRREKPRAGIGSREDERDAVVAPARQKNPVAFAPWTREEEREVQNVAAFESVLLGGAMAIFESLANVLKALAVGDRVKVTLRPETGRFPNPMEGQITQKDASGSFSLESAQGVIQISAGDILSITRLQR